MLLVKLSVFITSAKYDNIHSVSEILLVRLSVFITSAKYITKRMPVSFRKISMVIHSRSSFRRSGLSGKALSSFR